MIHNIKIAYMKVTLEENKDNTVAPDVIPQTGESHLIEKMLIIFTIVMFGLAIINKMKNK